jgi:predicted RNA-binding Zn ribbon-like protein
MKLVGGDPSLDFVNTVGGRVPIGRRTRVRNDKLESYADLVAFAVHRGLVAEAGARALLRRSQGRPRAAEAALARARTFRESLYRALRALMGGRRPSPTDLDRINAEVRACRSRESLATRSEGLAWEWHDGGRALETPLWPIVRTAAALLTSGDVRGLRECDGEGCGWLFLDRSRNRRRRWCSMEDCGNLEKVRRFRRRTRRDRGPGSGG